LRSRYQLVSTMAGSAVRSVSRRGGGPRSILLAGIISSAALILASPDGRRAYAQGTTGTPMEDTVELSNGGFIRGEIVELNPGDYLIIRGPDGKPRQFPLSQVRTATRGGKPLDLTQAGASGAAAGSPPPPPQPGT